MELMCCFKQKTAYEVQISDWRSDGCDSGRPSAQTGGVPGFTGPTSDSNAPGAGRTPPLAGVAVVRLQLAPGLCGNRGTVLLRQLPRRITIRSSRTRFVDRKSPRLNSSH